MLRALKLGIGLLLLALLFFWDDHGERAIELLGRIHLQSAATLFALSLLMNWLSAAKWFLILRARGNRVPLSNLTSLYLVGKFFSNFAPGMVGGDLARVLMLGRRVGSQAQAAASVFLERFTGFLALVGLAAVAAALHPALMQAPSIGLTLTLFSLICAASIALLYMPHWYGRAIAYGQHISYMRPWMGKADRLIGEIAFFRERHDVLLVSVLLSVLFYGLAAFSLYTACLAVAHDAPFARVATVTPAIYLATAIPVSPNNVGWWEWCVGVLLQQTGAELAQGIAAALLVRAASLCVSLVGGALFLGYRTHNNGQG